MDEDDDYFDFTRPGALTPPPKAAAIPASPGVPPAESPAAVAISEPSAVEAKSRVYNSALARRLFELGGQQETLAKGVHLFEEEDSAGGVTPDGRMYFVHSGAVSLTAGGKMIDTIRAGEVVGEMAVITGGNRTATATARVDTVVYSLNVDQFRTAIQKMPEFTLMLMSVLFDRLRLASARLSARKVPPTKSERRESEVFGPDIVSKLAERLGPSALMVHPRAAEIMKEGEAGAQMYIVRDGRVAISVGGIVVETLGPGGLFGEMALVDQSARSATATALMQCELLALDREGLLALVRAHPAFGLTLLKSVALRLRHMNALVAG